MFKFSYNQIFSGASMSLSIDQALTISRFFVDDKKVTQTKMKKLDQDQRKICVNAFEIVKQSNLDDFKHKKPGTLENAIIDTIKTKLEEADAPDAPDTRSFLEKVADTIVGIWTSILKWFSNIFLGRISSSNLFETAANFRNDIHSAQQTKEKYNSGDPEATKEEKRKPRLLIAKEKVDAAQKDYDAHGKELVGLINAHEVLKTLEVKSQQGDFQNKIFDRATIRDEDSDYIKIGKSKKLSALDIVSTIHLHLFRDDGHGNYLCSDIEKDIIVPLVAEYDNIRKEQNELIKSAKKPSELEDLKNKQKEKIDELTTKLNNEIKTLEDAEVEETRNLTQMFDDMKKQTADKRDADVAKEPNPAEQGNIIADANHRIKLAQDQCDEDIKELKKKSADEIQKVRDAYNKDKQKLKASYKDDKKEILEASKKKLEQALLDRENIDNERLSIEFSVAVDKFNAKKKEYLNKDDGISVKIKGEFEKQINTLRHREQKLELFELKYPLK